MACSVMNRSFRSGHVCTRSVRRDQTIVWVRFRPRRGTLRCVPQLSPVVCVVDDDESSREAIEGLLRSAGFDVRAFDSAFAFLEWDARERTNCLISDYSMTPMNGAELQQVLAARGAAYPLIFVTAFADDELK